MSRNLSSKTIPMTGPMADIGRNTNTAFEFVRASPNSLKLVLHRSADQPLALDQSTKYKV
ncbi:hypothetical protein K504DRAFT_463981 [Pleomassaria siparia CBS 279.74]|uniref:Uncharacterized protein n=1 Tax=Pleomassaria siparia CBS 279.74 TaxID=1314801 RepID=A0A6G1JRD0_9PLEO|nr:hypothetical protein K504DRAFT_463981 [Pleomassaria siparia CBS 279.74]